MWQRLGIILFIVIVVGSRALHAEWVNRVALHVAQECFGYDSCGKALPLGDIVFGRPMVLQDIYLPSKLSALGVVTLKGGSGFGTNPEEQYLAALAGTKLQWHASLQESRSTYEMGYYGTVEGVYFPSLWYVGGMVSVVKKKHELFLETINNKITVNGLSIPPISGESTVKQFLLDAGIDFLDFFNRHVLEPKGLTYMPVNEGIGFADPVLIFLLDWCGRWKQIKTLQLGFTVGIPFAKRPNPDCVWPLAYGLGAWSLGGQFALQAKTKKWFFNPFLEVGCTYFFPYQSKVRLNEQVSSLLYGEMPKRFILNIIKPFFEYDSLVHQFSDTVKDVFLYHGFEYRVLVGNTARFLKNTFVLGLFYEAMFNDRVEYRKHDRLFDEKKMYREACNAHTILGHISCVLANTLQVSIQCAQQISGRMIGRRSSFTFNIVYKV